LELDSTTVKRRLLSVLAFAVISLILFFPDVVLRPAFQGVTDCRLLAAVGLLHLFVALGPPPVDIPRVLE